MPYETLLAVDVVASDTIAWFDAMSDAVLIVDARHRIMFANASISRMFGHNRRALIGRDLNILLPIRSQAAHRKLVAEFAEGGTSLRAHEAALLTGQHVDGHEFQVDVTISRRLSDEGALMIAVIRDATRRVTQARALEQKSEKFRLIAEASHDALYSWDPINGTKWLGDGVTLFFGYDPRQAANLAWWESRIHPDDRARVMASIEQHWASTALTWSMEYRFRRADGSDAIVLNRSIATRDETGAIVLAMGALMDITELRNAQSQMVHANKMEAIGRLAGGVAHDFNNLLSVILSSAELLMEGYSADDPRIADVSEIHHAATRASQVTRQLLTLSRRDRSTPQLVCLNGALRDVRRLLQRLLGGTIEVSLIAPTSELYVSIDVTKFEQVLINLAVNARDAMPSGGQLLIEVQVEAPRAASSPSARQPSADGWAQITVRDSGRGIPADVLPHIFEPFFTTKDADHGTGLGLSICYAIVRDGGGDLSVTSEVGVGTTFSIRLPLTAARPTRASPAARVSARTGRERILLVEDEPALLASYSHALQRAGYRVISALTPDGAIDELADRLHTFDLFICDLRLPRMHGTVLAQTLRRTHLIPRILFISGFDEDLMAVADAGLSGASTARKPLAGGELLERVRAALEQPVALERVHGPSTSSNV